MINKFTVYLMLFWLTVLTATGCYIIRAEHEFLKFADFVIDDNLKNVIQSGGATFYIVDMDNWATANLGTNVRLWRPLYVMDKDMGKLVDWKRKQTLMVRDFENINWQSKVIAEQADRYIKLRLSGMQDRKKTPEQKTKDADQRKRKHV